MWKGIETVCASPASMNDSDKGQRQTAIGVLKTRSRNIFNVLLAANMGFQGYIRRKGKFGQRDMVLIRLERQKRNDPFDVVQQRLEFRVFCQSTKV